MNEVSLRLFRSLRTILPYSPAGSDTVWVVVEDQAEMEEWMASLPGKWNLVRRDKVGGNVGGGQGNQDAADLLLGLGGPAGRPDRDAEAVGSVDRAHTSVLGETNALNDAQDAGASSNAGNAAGRDAAAAALLTADMLNWRHRYACDHAGQPQKSRRNPNLSPSKRRCHQPSIKVGCKAKFIAFQPIGERRVFIKWTFAHNNHDVSSLKSVAESRLPRRVRDWIRDRVSEGRDWKAIRNLLRLDEAELDCLEGRFGPLQSVPEALRIRRMDVYNELRRQLLRVARKADNRVESLRLWAVEVVQEGGKAAVELNIPSAESEQRWAAHFMTSWQSDMLAAHGQQSVVCLDSTHNTCFGFAKNEKVWLYSLVVRSTTTGRGIPVAFMVTNGEDAQPITWWLEALRRDVRLKPAQFMIDCSSTEVCAITAAFPNPVTPTILFCDWHMLKAMTANSKLKVKGHGGFPRGALRTSDNQQAQRRARAGFMALMGVLDRQEFAARAEAYLEEWSCCPEWVQYVSDTWLVRKEKWARAWRRDAHRGVDTNNYMESWHNQLKTAYIGLMRKQGVDVLLWFLVRQCVPDYRTNELRVALGLQACALTQRDLQARQKALDITTTEALALVAQDDGGAITVDSFSAGGVRYSLLQQLDALGDEYELSSCSCPAFQHSEFPCKHMWLAHRVLGLPLSQFSRKVKFLPTTQPAPLAAASGGFSPAPAPAAPSSTAVSASDHAEAVRVRQERNQALSLAFDELDKVGQLAEQLRALVLDPDFVCSRAQASELGARLETVRHLMLDVIYRRSLHERQSVGSRRSL